MLSITVTQTDHNMNEWRRYTDQCCFETASEHYKWSRAVPSPKLIVVSRSVVFLVLQMEITQHNSSAGTF